MTDISSSIELATRSFIDIDTPSLGGGVAFVVVFSIFTIINFVICYTHHQWWFLSTWGIGLALEIVGYAGRIWYHKNDNNGNAYIMELVCITVAPCFLMAGVYYILAQLVLIYGNHFSYLKPMSYSAIFIVCDLISICVQGAGGGTSNGDSASSENGRYIMIGGLAFQVATITVFMFFWFSFISKIFKSKKLYGESQFNPLYSDLRQRRERYLFFFFFAVTGTVLLIYTRSIFRLIETSKGWDSYLSKKEIYFNILEGLMISLSALLMAVFSPGLVYGKDAHLYIKKNGYHHFEDDVELKSEYENSARTTI